MPKYYKQSTDKVQKDIVKTLRKMGYSVETGHDDILVGYRGFTFWYEIKQPEYVSKKTGKVWNTMIKTSQQKLLQSFKGHYQIVWSVEQIVNDIGEKLCSR